MKTPLLSLFFALLVAVAPALASPPADTLAKVSETGRFVIGFREDARPFSYRDSDGNPAGYSVDLCRRIATIVKEASGRDEIDVQYVPVDAADRFSAVQSGEVDIMCEAVTDTLERRAEADFTLHIFITGAEMLVKTDSGIGDISDLSGKKAGVLAGTTTETAIREALKTQMIDAEVTTFEEHGAGLAAVEDGTIDAYFADRMLLLGLGQQAKDAKTLQLSGRFYSYEPYAFMLRRGDDKLRLAADTALANLYRTGQIWEIYRKHFGDAEPSELLVAMFILNGIPEK
jgi:polar amino acid transport system substrate-binding protein/glutamate/aspartate transport system substrate-binding protein